MPRLLNTHSNLCGSQYHQHMFSMRIDPAVDDADGGLGLVVAEVSSSPPK